MSLVPVDYEAITLADTTVKTLTATKYAPTTGDYAGRTAVEAWIAVQDGGVIWTMHGVDPDAGNDVGLKSDAGYLLKLTGLPSISGFRAVKPGATTAKLKVIYFFAPLPTVEAIPERLW